MLGIDGAGRCQLPKNHGSAKDVVAKTHFTLGKGSFIARSATMATEIACPRKARHAPESSLGDLPVTRDLQISSSALLGAACSTSLDETRCETDGVISKRFHAEGKTTPLANMATTWSY